MPALLTPIVPSCMSIVVAMLGALRALASASIVAAAALLVACGSPLEPAGSQCSLDSDCGAGLSCLDLANSPGAGCSTLVRVCSKPCKTTADCTAVGPKFECVPTCDGGGTCGLTE